MRSSPFDLQIALTSSPSIQSVIFRMAIEVGPLRCDRIWPYKIGFEDRPIASQRRKWRTGPRLTRRGRAAVGEGRRMRKHDAKFRYSLIWKHMNRPCRESEPQRSA